MLMMVRKESYDNESHLMMVRNSSADDDISSVNSDFIKPRFRNKNNMSQNDDYDDYGSDESSEMEVISEDE